MKGQKGKRFVEFYMAAQVLIRTARSTCSIFASARLPLAEDAVFVALNYAISNAGIAQACLPRADQPGPWLTDYSRAITKLSTAVGDLVTHLAATEGWRSGSGVLGAVEALEIAHEGLSDAAEALAAALELHLKP